MDDSAENGGEGGGKLILKRSELAILRKMSSRFPIVDGERRETVEIIMDTMRTSRSRRTKIAAAKALGALDKLNLDEMRVYLDAQRTAKPDLQPASAVTVNINLSADELDKLSDAELLRLHRQTLALPGPDQDIGSSPGGASPLPA